MRQAGWALVLVALVSCMAEEAGRGRRGGSTDDVTSADVRDVAAPKDGKATGEVGSEGTSDTAAADVRDVASADGADSGHADGSIVPDAPSLPDVRADASPESLSEPLPEPVAEARPDVGPEPAPDTAEPIADAPPPYDMWGGTWTSVADVQGSVASTGCAGDPAVVATGLFFEDLMVVSPRFVINSTYDGYYVADTWGNGPFHGVMLLVPVSLGVTLKAGDLVDVLGDHKEYYCETEVIAQKVTRYPASGWMLDPWPVSGSQIGALDPAAEPLEGLLVRVEGGTVTALDLYGEIVIDDTWRIANEFDLPYLMDGGGRAVGDQIVSVVGVVEYSWGRYLVNPRYESDLVVVTP